MTEEEAVKIFDLVVREKMLPATLDKLVPLSFIGAAAVKFYQAKVKLMDQLGITEVQRKATLSDGQDAGEMLLNIETRIGELVDATETKIVRTGPHGSRSAYPPELSGEEGHKKRKNATAISRNPAAVKAIIKEARENEDIPTKTAVLNKIALDKEKARREAAEKREKPDIVVSLEEQKALNALEGLVAKCPRADEWPKDWHEPAFKQAQGYVKIIFKRLEVFTNGEQGKAQKSITG